MELYFLRHGIAADAGPAGTGDAGRPLTKEGVTKMEAEARGLRRLKVKSDTLLYSPLVRARQTAEIVAREHIVIDVFGRHVGGEARTTLGQRHH